MHKTYISGLGNPNPPGMLVTARRIVQSEGLSGLYTGLTASLMRQASFIGTKFFVYEQVKNIIENPDNSIGKRNDV